MGPGWAVRPADASARRFQPAAAFSADSSAYAWATATKSVIAVCGENSASTRAGIASYLGYLGCELDADANKKRGEDVEVSTPGSKVRMFVIPTNEELVIARDTRDIVGK